MTTGGDLLSVDGLTVPRGGRNVVREVSLEIPAGEITALLDPNGAGKSSMVLAMGGILKPVAGKVVLDGQDLAGKRPERIRRAGLAIVDAGLVRDERGLGKPAGEVRLQLVVVGTDQNGADTIDTTGDQHPAQGAFAGRMEENVNGNIGMRCRGCMLQESFGNHEVHWFSSFDLSS